MRVPLVDSSGNESVFDLRPSKILGVGRNYRAHAAELGNVVPTEPLIFFKAPSSLLASGEVIVRPSGYERVDFEGELGIVIGKSGRNITADRALEHVLGAICLNDVTVRDLQKSDKQWWRAKGFDTFCPVGPRIVCGLDFGDLSIETRQNGEVRQNSRTSLMVHSVAKVIAFASSAMTLEEGDLIATGTPAGVGPIEAGDRIEIEIEGIGVLENTVASSDE